MSGAGTGAGCRSATGEATTINCERSEGCNGRSPALAASPRANPGGRDRTAFRRVTQARHETHHSRLTLVPPVPASARLSAC
jgi:hypothetical protein